MFLAIDSKSTPADDRTMTHERSRHKINHCRMICSPIIYKRNVSGICLSLALVLSSVCYENQIYITKRELIFVILRTSSDWKQLALDGSTTSKILISIIIEPNLL